MNLFEEYEFFTSLKGKTIKHKLGTPKLVVNVKFVRSIIVPEDDPYWYILYQSGYGVGRFTKEDFLKDFVVL